MPHNDRTGVTTYLSAAICAHDRHAPWEALLWHWWATRDGASMVPAAWLERRTGPATSWMLAKADFASARALLAIRRKSGELLCLEFLHRIGDIRDELLDPEFPKSELSACLSKLVRVAVISLSEFEALRRDHGGQSPANPFARFGLAGVILQAVSPTAAYPPTLLSCRPAPPRLLSGLCALARGDN